MPAEHLQLIKGQMQRRIAATAKKLFKPQNVALFFTFLGQKKIYGQGKGKVYGSM